MSADLVAFLRARLDDDERIARAACDSMRVSGDGVGWFDTDGMADEGRAHLEHFNPARVLADIDSKRRILDWLDAVERYMDRDDMSWHRLGGAIDVDHVRVLLAAPYRGHPDWRTEWNA